METVIDTHDFGTYPRRFHTYRWYKPLLVGILFVIFTILIQSLINSLTALLFSTTVSWSSYDELDFFSPAGAFCNTARGAAALPGLILAALIVRDRPISSYFSSMGGWRWNIFLKTLLAALILVGLPIVIFHVAQGKSGDLKLTAGAALLLIALLPFQAVAEEMEYRGFIMQTFSSWFQRTAVGVIVQLLIFAAMHPYNIIGVIEVAISALIYALVCLFSKGIESSSALHMVNNMSGIFLVGFGYGALSSEVTVPGLIISTVPKVLFFLFILYADRKLHWFDEVKRDDVARFHTGRSTSYREIHGE